MRKDPDHPEAGERHPWWEIFDFRQSLRMQAALVCGGLTLATAVGFSSIATRQAQQQVEPVLGPYFEGLASQITERIDRGVYERYHELTLLAASAPFTDTDATAEDRRPVIDRLNDTSTEYAWIGFADANGQIRVAAHGVLEDTDVRGQTWFQSARGRVYRGNPHDAPELEGLVSNPSGLKLRVFDLAIPVRDAAGRFAGVLCAQLRWSWVQEIETAVVPESARRGLQGVTMYAGTDNVIFDSGASGWSRPPDYPQLPSQQRYHGYMQENADGPIYFTGYALSRDYRDLPASGWLVAVRQPYERAFAGVRDLRRQILVVGYLLSAAVFALAWFVAGRLVRRLQGVGSAADLIRKGEILTVFPKTAGGEFGRMCAALNRMLQDFRDRTHRLERERDRLEQKVRAAEAPPVPPRGAGGNRGH